MARIFLIAGEASGDVLGARLMTALRARQPDLVFSGIGGPRMEEAGMVSQFPMQELAVMGLAEILPRILLLRRRLNETVAAIKESRPDIVVTIDSPGFCLRVLKALSGTGIKRVHYVAPQVWAWRQERVKKFPGLWDELLCLLPFEPEFFAPHGLHPLFTGHPVLESGAGSGDAARFCAAHGLTPADVPVVLMPGSRVTETTRLLPVFRDTMARLREKIPGLRPVLAAAPVIADVVEAHTQDWKTRPIIVRDVATRYDAFAAARAALTKSGTSTLELAMAGVPMAVTYRVNPLSAAIGRRLIKVKHVAIINLLAGHALVPELLQENCTPEKLSATLQTLLTDANAAAMQRQGFSTALASLQAPDGKPSAAAAKAILKLLD
ncbi:MAG TPA: lipid-A-disaccharide synthase [Acidocella sp.]|jgi:lipid-A-disaccharide synthase|uniref:lipid-A-disaccharide synthase n=1 Tax=Acidocella sp. TaxID=50710 RepID=UPI002CD96170|nr:lipid-A-disaccharide synthase [Acidocella sp.]HVE23693.1 lipid-A-disaccharide synthase [Acidocella sp.]